jgi:hypothetical protein
LQTDTNCTRQASERTTMKLYYLLLLSALSSVPATFHLRLLSIVIMTTHFNCFWPAPPRLSSEVCLTPKEHLLLVNSELSRETDRNSKLHCWWMLQPADQSPDHPPSLLRDFIALWRLLRINRNCLLPDLSGDLRLALPSNNFSRQIFTLFPAHPIPPIPFASFLSQFLPESRCSLRSLPRSVRHRCPSSKLTHRNRLPLSLPLSLSLGVSSLKTLCTLVSY